MKKTIFIATLVLLSSFSLSAGAVHAVTWNDCPFGMVEDQYPGDCSRYIDTDGDGICDHSQPPPEQRTGGTDEVGFLEEAVQTESGKININYHLGTIFFSLLGLYFLSQFLSRKKVISTPSHRKWWNAFLTVFFVLNLFTSLLLIAQLQFDLGRVLPFNLTFWHVETGIIFSLIAIFHTLWHLPYYRKLLRS